MASYPLLWLPLAALAVLSIGGIGIATLLGRRFPADAQAALAAPVGAAALICASPLVELGISARAIGLSALTLLLVATVILRRRVVIAAHAAVVPLVVALVALVFAIAPVVRYADEGTYSLGNADPYLWVSEARSFIDGPPPAPSTEFPDRRAYEYTSELHWTVGLPFALAQVAVLGGLDPESAYGSFAAVVAALLALAVYAGARACLEWRPKVAAVASGLVSANALLLYSTLYGWQAQLALTTFGLLSLLFLRLAYDDDAPARERVLVGLFVAAGLSVYGMLFAWFAALLGICTVGWFVAMRRARWRRATLVAAGSGAAALVLAAVPLADAVLQLGVTPDAADSSRWDWYAHGLPPEALGLIPRIGVAVLPPWPWSLAAIAISALLIVLALRTHGLSSRADVLASTSLFSLAVVALLQLPGPNPYLSLKIAAYSAPILTLFALQGILRPQLRGSRRVALVACAGSLFAAAALVVLVQPSIHMRSSRPYASVRDAVSNLPEASPVAVAVGDTWSQLWLVYFLRDRPLVVLRPTEYLCGFGAARHTNERQSRTHFRYVIARGRSAHAIWATTEETALTKVGSAIARPSVYLRRIRSSSAAALSEPSETGVSARSRSTTCGAPARSPGA